MFEPLRLQTALLLGRNTLSTQHESYVLQPQLLTRIPAGAGEGTNRLLLEPGVSGTASNVGPLHAPSQAASAGACESY